jgi:hypothetical protein
MHVWAPPTEIAVAAEVVTAEADPTVYLALCQAPPASADIRQRSDKTMKRANMREPRSG